MLAYPDWTNVFKELRHLLNLRLLSQPCDVYCAVLRVILLFRTSCKHVKTGEGVSNFIFFLKFFNTVMPSTAKPLLTHITLISTHWSCESVIGERTKGGKSVRVPEATPEEYYKDNPDAPSNTEPYWEGENGTLSFTTISSSYTLNIKLTISDPVNKVKASKTGL